MRFIDLCCGIGGIRIGMERAGFSCVFSCDINRECQKTYYDNFGEMPQGDIAKINIDSIPEHEILCAGFPCQPFSISGKQKGFMDARGTLFFEICRIISTKSPQIVFLENVKHLVHHDGGRTLKTIISELENLGYDVGWKLLNASDFGVPQNRERIIIIASRFGKFDFSLIKKAAKLKLSDFLDESGEFEYLKKEEYTLIEEPKKQASGLIFVGYRNKSIRKVGVREGTEHLSRVHKQPNRIYSVKGTHPTLSSQETSGRFFILTNEGKVRKLTINECFRIMGFPDDFIRNCTTGEQYKQIGNSVCVPMIQEIAEQIKKQYYTPRKDYKDELYRSVGRCI